MITYKEKRVLVVGVDRGGSAARVHYVNAIGKSDDVLVQDLCADTSDELETALADAPVIAIPTNPAPREVYEYLLT
jgi:hypothetical protein